LFVTLQSESIFQAVSWVLQTAIVSSWRAFVRKNGRKTPFFKDCSIDPSVNFPLIYPSSIALDYDVQFIDTAIDRSDQQLIALSRRQAANPIHLFGAIKLCSDQFFVAANVSMQMISSKLCRGS
jgi:hypothetical protein